MKITISTSVIALSNGTYLPKFSLIQPIGNGKKITSYTLSEEAACTTEIEAWIHASDYGRKEVIKIYGEYIEVNIVKEV